MILVLGSSHLMLLTACDRVSDETWLPNNYRLVADKTAATIDLPPGPILIPSSSCWDCTIARFAVIKPFVVGEVVSTIDGSSKGFFILDTDTGVVQDDLDVARFHSEMSSRGIRGDTFFTNLR